MRLLAIDTALALCSVGVQADAGPPVLITETIERGHAERLMGMVEEAMAAAGLAFFDLERIAVTVGPGSFSGVRIGVAAARGLALVTGCPVAGVSTLAVLAAEARGLAGKKRVMAALDARRGEVYAQGFDDDGTALIPPQAGTPERVAGDLQPGMLLAGSGAPLIAAAAGGDAESRIIHRNAAPDIGTLVALAMTMPGPVAPPRPLYLRPPDAKPQSGAVARQ